METKKTEEQPDYAILRHQLKLLAKQFDACTSFIEKIDDIQDSRSFKRFFTREIENICDRLDIEIFSENEDELEDLQDQLYDMERDKESAEQELEDFKWKYGLGKDNSLSDEYKCQFFCEYKNDYTEWQLEELLKNGKQYLHNLRVA